MRIDPVPCPTCGKPGYAGLYCWRHYWERRWRKEEGVIPLEIREETIAHYNQQACGRAEG